MNRTLRDKRIKVKTFTWKNFAAMYLTLLIYSVGQYVIMALHYAASDGIPTKLMIRMLVYWGVSSLFFCVLARRYVFAAYDEPILRLGDAARQVTRSDFSIYVPPEHSADEANHLDVLTQDFNKMVASLGSGEVMKSNFVANVSHEIRTPVAIIESSAELLSHDNLSREKQQAHIANIQKSTQVLVNLSKKLLTLNQLESYTMAVVTQKYNLYDQLCEQILAYEEPLEEKHIELDVDVNEDLTIRADPGLLDIVWDNLLSNAIKFTPAGGKISLHASTDESGVMVSVRDNGCGMSEDIMNHAFEKFYQGDTSHSQEGNGLGLSLARAAVQLAHGTISILSNVGAGSEFLVHLAQ